MWSFIGNMFGSSKTGEKLVDNISNGLDKLVYTKEEQADDQAAARTEGFNVFTEWLKSTSGSRLARRFIAVVTVSIWAVEHALAVLMDIISPFIKNPDDALRFVQASDSLAGYAADNQALVGVVLLFYFGGPAATDAVKGIVTKWVDKKK